MFFLPTLNRLTVTCPPRSSSLMAAMTAVRLKPVSVAMVPIPGQARPVLSFACRAMQFATARVIPDTGNPQAHAHRSVGFHAPGAAVRAERDATWCGSGWKLRLWISGQLCGTVHGLLSRSGRRKVGAFCRPSLSQVLRFGVDFRDLCGDRIRVARRRCSVLLSVSQQLTPLDSNTLDKFRMRTRFEIWQNRRSPLW